VELDSNTCHCGFEILDFLAPDGESQLTKFLHLELSSVSDSMQALRNLDDPELQRLSLLSGVSRLLNSKLGYTESLTRVIEVMKESVGAERGLLLLDRGGSRPCVEVAIGPEALSQRGLAYSETLVREVLEKGRPVLSLDVRKDQTLGTVASLKILGTVCVLCVPLRSGTRNFGLIYLDSSVAKGIFTESDLMLTTIIADLSAAAIERSHYFNQVVQSEKMAALGTLVAGLAHELLSPLGAIKTLGECWKSEETEPDDPDLMLEQAERCVAMVKDLLVLSRGGNVAFGPVNLYDVLRTVESLVSPDLKTKGLKLTLDCPDDLPDIMGNEKQLVQVFLNLAVNAISILSKGGAITILAAPDGALIRVSVMDNGEGIPAENLNRIFDPFVTTRADGHGLGLSIIQRLVQDHQGLVYAQNRPEGGAVFTVELPVDSETVATTETIS
jgi:nitrogen-specific signal transduction histidine kinase